MSVVPVAVAMLGFGQVRHARSRPARHAFTYPTYFLMLPLRAMRAAQAPMQALPAGSALRRNRRGALSFYDCDHGDGRADALAWLDELLASEGIADAVGEVWLHTYPRVWGYAFKPVSFWYCHSTSGALRLIVVEVNNTFGERHCYLLEQPHYGQPLRADKALHVSPFCTLEGTYEFRFMRSTAGGADRTVARIDYHDDAGLLLKTSVSGELEPLTPASLRKALWRYPAMSFGLIARIHWQAMRLWLKRVPFVSKPPPPTTFLTR